MMELKHIKELGRIITGNTPPTKENKYYGDYMPFIKATDISEKSKFTYETEESYSKIAYEKYIQNLVPKGSTCVVTIGSVGKKLTKAHCNLFVNQAINAIVPNEEYNEDYIYYLLKNNLSQLKLFDSGTASGRENISKSSFSKIRVLVELDKDKQTKIGGILSLFDDLIENNNKRIKILEQMADELYKEWFVKCRFPGYQNSTFKHINPTGWVLGSHNDMLVPEKWHFGPLSEIGIFVRGKNITTDKMIEGEIPVVSAGIEPSGYHNESNVKGVSLTMSASGANAGYLKYNLNNIWAADCSYYQNDSNIWFVYHSLNFIKKAIDNLQVGSAQPHVYPKNINKLCIMIPEQHYIEKFNEMVKPYYREIDIINQKNKNLIKQRDLLLPRLMSGKLKVK